MVLKPGVPHFRKPPCKSLWIDDHAPKTGWIPWIFTMEIINKVTRSCNPSPSPFFQCAPDLGGRPFFFHSLANQTSGGTPFFLVYGKLAASKGFQYLPGTTLIWKILQVSESTGLLSWGPPVFQAVASIQKPHIKSQLSDQLLSSFCPPNLTSASSRRRSGCKDLNDRKRRVWTLWDWTISIQFKCLSNETLKCPSTHLDT